MVSAKDVPGIKIISAGWRETGECSGRREGHFGSIITSCSTWVGVQLNAIMMSSYAIWPFYAGKSDMILRRMQARLSCSIRLVLLNDRFWIVQNSKLMGT